MIGNGTQGSLPLRRGRRAASGGQRHRAGRSVPHAGDVAHPGIGEGQHVLAVLIATRDGQNDLRVPIVDQLQIRYERDGTARSCRVVRLLEVGADGCRRDLDANLRRRAGHLAIGALEAIAVDRPGLGVVVPQRRIDGDAAVERVCVARERVGHIVQNVPHGHRIHAGRERDRQRATGHRVGTDRHAVEHDIAAVEEETSERIASATENVSAVRTAVTDQGQNGVAVVADTVGHQRIELSVGNTGAAGAQPDGRTTDRVLNGASCRVVAPGRNDRSRIGQSVAEVDPRNRRHATGRKRVLRIAGDEAALGVLEQDAGSAVRRVDQCFRTTTGRRRGRRQRSRDIRGDVRRQQERVGAAHVGKSRRRAGSPGAGQADALQPRVGRRVPPEILAIQGRADIVPDIALDQAEADGRIRRIVVEGAARTVALARSGTRRADAVTVVGCTIEIAGCDEAVGVVERRVGHRRRGVCNRLGPVGHRRRIGEGLRYADSECHRSQESVGTVARRDEQIVRSSRQREAADRALVAGERIVEVDVIGLRIAVVGKRDLPFHLTRRLVDRFDDLADGDVGFEHGRRDARGVGRADGSDGTEERTSLIAECILDDCRELDDGVVRHVRVGIVLDGAERKGGDVAHDGGSRHRCGDRLRCRIEAARTAVDLDRASIPSRIDRRRCHRPVGARQRHEGVADILQPRRQLDVDVHIAVLALGDFHIGAHADQLARHDVCRRCGDRRCGRRKVGAVRLIDDHKSRHKGADRHRPRGRVHGVAALARYRARHRGVGAGST